MIRLTVLVVVVVVVVAVVVVAVPVRGLTKAATVDRSRSRFRGRPRIDDERGEARIFGGIIKNNIVQASHNIMVDLDGTIPSHERGALKFFVRGTCDCVKGGSGIQSSSPGWSMIETVPYLTRVVVCYVIT